MQKMKAVGFYRALAANDPDSMVDVQLPIPIPHPHEILVKVATISVNPADYRIRQRKEDNGQLAIAGWDIAGTVVAIGEDAVGFQIGDKVFYAGDVTKPGGNSEYHVVDAQLVAHKPKTLSMAQSAAIPLTAITAWEVLFEHFNFDIEHGAKGKTLLIIGGAGGVGSMLIQLAKQIPDLQVVATASREASTLWCRQLGADKVINHHQDIVMQLQQLGIQTVDKVLIANAPDAYFSILADMVTPFGQICSLVPFEHPQNLNALMAKSLSFIWAFMFTRTMYQTQDVAKQGEILAQIATLLDKGHVVSTATQDFGVINAANLRRAHAYLESGQAIGKLTLTGFETQ